MRLKKTGELDAMGGKGQMATFVVAPSDRGFLRLQNVHDMTAYLAVGKGQLRKGEGGQACDLLLAPNPAVPGAITVTHAHGHGGIAFDAVGNPCPPGNQPADPNFGAFRISNA